MSIILDGSDGITLSNSAEVVDTTSAQTITGKTLSGADNTLSNLNAADITSGTVGTARLGSGTADSTTFLRGDQTWQIVDTAPTAPTVSAGTYYYGDVSEITAGFSSYANTMSTRALCSGSVNVQFSISAPSGSIAYGRIYVNGVAVGTARSNSQVTPVLYTQAISVNVNDKIQIYTYSPTATVSLHGIRVGVDTPQYTPIVSGLLFSVYTSVMFTE